MNLNKHQRLAYDNPIVDGQPPTHMPEGWAAHPETVDGQAVTVALTVDVDTDHREIHGTDAVWQISVSVWPTSMAERLSHPEDLPIEVAKWTEAHQQIALKAHEANVRGISVRRQSADESPDKQGTVGPGTYAMHLWVPLNEEEREGLPVEPR